MSFSGFIENLVVFGSSTFYFAPDQIFVSIYA